MTRAFLIVVLTAAPAYAAPQVGSTGPQRVTVIGCVERAQPDAVGTTGTVAPTHEGARYVLTNVTVAPDEPQPETANALAASIPVYRLDDAQAATIAEHVGEKVKVSGVIERRNEESSPASSSTKQPPMLSIESLRGIVGASASCKR